MSFHLQSSIEIDSAGGGRFYCYGKVEFITYRFRPVIFNFLYL